MIKERTEEDKIVQAGIEVILGGKTYFIRPLVIRDSREWRAKVIKLVAPVPRNAMITMETPDDFERTLTDMMVTIPNQVIDLFFDYAKDLDREEIEGVATDEEISNAFRGVIEVAFPLAQNAPDVVMRPYQQKKKVKTSQ